MDLFAGIGEIEKDIKREKKKKENPIKTTKEKNQDQKKEVCISIVIINKEESVESIVNIEGETLSIKGNLEEIFEHIQKITAEKLKKDDKEKEQEKKKEKDEDQLPSLF